MCIKRVASPTYSKHTLISNNFNTNHCTCHTHRNDHLYNSKGHSFCIATFLVPMCIDTCVAHIRSLCHCSTYFTLCKSMLPDTRKAYFFRFIPKFELRDVIVAIDTIDFLLVHYIIPMLLAFLFFQTRHPDPWRIVNFVSRKKFSSKRTATQCNP